MSQACLFLLLFTLANASCPSSLSPGEHLIATNVGGLNREFYVMVPEGMPASASPGVVMLHGCGSSPEKFELESLMNQNAAFRKWFNVYPKGTGSNRLGWNAGSGACATGGIPNDVDFMRAVVLYMVENLCVDVDRIFVAGFSNGAQMTFNMSCTMTDTFAAFSGSGMSMNAAFFPEHCGVPPTEIKPFHMICGSQDSLCATSQASWFQAWKDRVSCKGDAKVSHLSSTSTCTSYNNCGESGTQPLEACMIDGLGHCWSGNDCCDTQCLNQDKANMDASAHILEWFSRVPRSESARSFDQVSRGLRQHLGHHRFIYKGQSV